MATTLSSFLFDQLWQRGVRHIFGIPGDFVLNLYEALERDGRFGLVRLSHEPAVGFAADGCARITGGLGVCCVTYGAGGLNMVNSVACAYAEESPLVVLSGGPGRIEKRAGLPVHHEVKSFESQLRVYAEVTEYSAILDDPRTAAAHIARALDVAVKMKRPVYLEIPRDMVGAEIDDPPPEAALELATDAGAVAEAVAEITERLLAAERPVLIVGVEVHRFQLRDQVVQLAERLGVPVASSFLGRGVFPTRHPQFAGTYLGVVSPPPLRDVVENSDCVLLLGELISDTSLGVSAQRLTESNLIICVAREVFVGHHRYHDTPLERVVSGLLDVPSLGSAPAHAAAVPAPVSSGAEPRSPDSAPMNVLRLIEARQRICRSTSGGAARLGHRRLSFCGGRNPVQRLRSSGILRDDGVCDSCRPRLAGGQRPPAAGPRRRRRVPDDRSRDRARRGARMQPDCRAPQQRALGDAAGVLPPRHLQRDGVVAVRAARGVVGRAGCGGRTLGEFRAALREAWDEPRFTLIEVPLAKGDISPVLSRFVAAFKERVYR